LVVGGSGSLTGELEARVARHGIGDRTRFIGMVPEAGLAPLLRGACAYVTAAEVDGTSVTLLQAMATGAAAVASDSAGNLGWITDGTTGLVFPVGSIDGLAVAIDRAAGSSAEAMRAAALDLVHDRADWHANLPRLREALCASRPPRLRG
ncbi:MAG: glycosyltransferase, partial [Candidatus Nanopelagicales bacterium]